MSLDPGVRLGPYEVLATIGAGGMGEVYRARDTRLDRLVALKILPAEINADPSRLRRFQIEARAAAALSHPNIVAVYDVGETGGVSYIVSELVEGQPLASRLGGRPIPLPELLELAIPVAEALARAHARGIVHRDLKPSNILLSADGQPKIADFGLARFDLGAAASLDSRSPTLADNRTREGTILGTAPYMSPEQARGDPADARSDQFSFGVILYELATAKRPFDRESHVQTLAAVLDQEPSWGSGFPEALKPIVQRCLAKDPGKRYAATEDLVHDLRALRDQTRNVPRTTRRYGLLFGGLASVDQRIGHFHHALFALADVHALAGNKSQAIDYLRRTAETGMPCISCFEKDPLLGEVRNSPEFRSLIDELRAREAPYRASLQ